VAKPYPYSTLSSLPMTFATELTTSMELVIPRTNVRTKVARPVGLAPKAMACVVPLRWGAATRSPRTRHISNPTTRPVALATLKFVVATRIYAKCALISLPSKLRKFIVNFRRMIHPTILIQ